MKRKNKDSELISETFAVSFKGFKAIVKLLPKFIVKITEYVSDKLRFSISFKITTFYAFVFFLFLLLSNAAAISSFMYFINRNADNIKTDQGLLYVQFSSKTIELHNYLGGMAAILILSDILILLIMLSVGSKMSRRLLFPVKKMTETVRHISMKDMNTRLDVKGSKDELKDLAKTFNDMLDRMQISFEQQNRFVSNASHELRTPIAVIQGYANLLDRWGKEDKDVLEESITAIKAESENMKDLVEKLLFLARSDKNTQKVEISEFESKDLIEELVRETELITDKHQIINENIAELKLKGDRKLLKEALRIFIDNSIKYTPEGGSIKINSYILKKQLVIEIEDTGMGISKEDLPHIFDRFYRTDKSRTKESGGTGLGLSIAKWIILRHKGTIEVQSRLGSGTKISILLPL